MIELKPCPFCGCKALIVGERRYGVFVVACSQCTAEGPASIASKRDAAKFWNKRPPLLK